MAESLQEIESLRGEAFRAEAEKLLDAHFTERDPAPVDPPEDDDPPPAESEEPTDTVDDAAPAAPVEAAAPVAPATDWLTDDLKATAKAYGFDEDDLKAAGSPEQLTAMMKALNKQQAAAGAQAMRGEQHEQGGAPASAPPATPATQAVPGANDPDAILAKLKEEGYDEPIIAAFEQLSALTKQQQQWIQQQEQAHQQQVYAQEAQQFAGEICAKFTDLFGTDLTKATPDQQAKANAAYEAYLNLKWGEYARTGKVSDPKTLALRAVHAAFPDQIAKQARQAVLKKAQASSAKRIPTGNRTGGSYKGPVASDPDLMRAFKELEADPNHRLAK